LFVVDQRQIALSRQVRERPMTEVYVLGKSPAGIDFEQFGDVVKGVFLVGIDLRIDGVLDTGG
jgi:hypothetical protein